MEKQQEIVVRLQEAKTAADEAIKRAEDVRRKAELDIFGTYEADREKSDAEIA